MDTHELEATAEEIRRLVVKTIARAKGGHMGASLSEVDILTALFFGFMHCDPAAPEDPERDRFILSKGHGSEGLYCTLAHKAYFPQAMLDEYLTHDSPLTIHPTRHVPGVEMNTGALGHGFSNAVGVALSAKKSGRRFRTFVLTGDGELQEGTNWEAAMAAAHFKLGSLVVIVDNNRLQLADKIENTMRIEPLDRKFEAFGFDVQHVDGHSIGEILETLAGFDYGGEKPHAIIAHTVKGQGVSFMEGVPEWHHRIPTQEEAARALEELSK
jgi:transketolase